MFNRGEDVLSGSCLGFSEVECLEQVIVIEKDCQWYDFTKPSPDDYSTEWIYEDCCDIELTYTPPTELGNAWCEATTTGGNFYMGITYDDMEVVPIIPCATEKCEESSLIFAFVYKRKTATHVGV